MKRAAAWAVAVGLLAATTSAAAQTSSEGDEKRRSGYVETRAAGAASVVFDDDLINTPGMDATGAHLKVRGGPARFLLIQPRLNFLQELRKSVEAL